MEKVWNTDEGLYAYWWPQPGYRTDIGNWGDIIAPHIIRWLSGKKPIFKEKGGYRYITVGSILHLLQEYDIVWGTGMIDDRAINVPEGVVFHAVRGPLTRECLIKQGINVPEVYGDPGMLMKYIYMPDVDVEYSVGVIPHAVDVEEYKKKITKKLKEKFDLHFIDIWGGVEYVMDEVAKCEIIISSALHGIILAESLGKPTAFVVMSNKIIGGQFKFKDYYLSTGRKDITPIDWVKKIGANEIKKAICWAEEITKPKIDLEKLLEACPFNFKNRKL